MPNDFNHAIQAVQKNQLSEAKAILLTLEKSAVDDPHYWNLRAVVAIKQGDFLDAISCLNKALAIEHDNIHFLQNIALCYKNLQNYNKAESILLQSIQINAKDYVAWHRLGDVYLAEGKKQKAIASYEKAVALGDKNIHVLHHLASDSSQKFLFDKAISYYHQILAIAPDNEKILYELTATYKLIRATKQGIEYLTQLKNRAKNKKLVDVFIASLRLWAKDWSCYQDDLQIILEDTRLQLQTQGAMPHIPAFTSLFYIDDAAINLEIAKRFSAYQPEKRFQHKPDKIKENKKLRIGYVSDDFRGHAVGYLCKTLFKSLNATGLESYLYAHGGNDDSEYRKYFEETATKFHNIEKLSYLEVAELIYQDQIDILIDMKGQTTNSILPMFAYKPAPIQIAYLGYAGSTGSEYIDYILVDHVITPKSTQKYYSEKFIYLPHCYLPIDDTQEISKAISTKSENQLPEDKFIYCCFNSTYKIEPTVFTVWMNILKAVPNSILWLLSSSPEENNALLCYAESAGVDKNRIIFAKNKPPAEHLRRLQLADLFLDTYIVGAHTTASDSLWAGVPILTCTGNRFVSRVCTSLLQTQGLDELIAHDLKSYQKKAIYYGTHPEEIHKLKEKILLANKTKPLYNTLQLAQDLTKAYRLAWKRYCNGLPPDMIEVPK